MATAVRFKQIMTPRQPGEFARLKVLQGPDTGAVYVIFGAKALIGRGEETDVVISDLKASRVHAELLGSQVGWSVQDKGSANGILHNGKTVRNAVLKSNDTIGIGETILEFITSEVGTMILTAPPRNVSQVRAEEKLAAKRQSKAGTTGPAKNNRIVLILVALAVGYFLIPDGGGPKKPPSGLPTGANGKLVNGKSATSNTSNTGDLAAYLPKVQKNKTAESLFKEGLREYFDGNYNRAKSQFETVLQITPGHVLAKIYLENCDSSIKQQVNTHLEFGKKSFESGKTKEAKAHYERVMLLLFKDQTNSSYVEAKDQYDKIKKKDNEEDSS